MISTALTIGCAAFVALTLVGHAKGSLLTVATAKTLASCFFLALAVRASPFENGLDGYVAWIAIGLVLGAAGDVALVREDSKVWFLSGIGLFLAGHVAYIVAFHHHFSSPLIAVISLTLAAAFGVVVARWLWPTAGSLRGAVLAYIAVIALMIALAVATEEPMIIIGASLFFVSDLLVARQRFVTKSLNNRLIGLPLYYAGQLVLAWSVL